ncbi:MAG: MliC family protein [Candidatus Vogelbacteria bacterium]|nr:MliC family protein [Candidatus Vogelbacteria bacterium]
MKKYLIIPLVVLVLVSLPFVAKASVADNLWKVILSLQQQIRAILESRKGAIVSYDTNTGTSVCAQDAKQCHDGSYVGRTGARCEFNCPSAITSRFNDVVFACDNDKYIAAKIEIRPKVLGKVQLKLSDRFKTLELDQTFSGSGVRYTDQDEKIVFWNKGDTAFLIENGTTTFANCNIFANTSNWVFFNVSDYAFKYPKEMGQPTVSNKSGRQQITFKNSVYFESGLFKNEKTNRNKDPEELVQEAMNNPDNMNPVQSVYYAGGRRGIKLQFINGITGGGTTYYYFPISDGGAVLVASEYGRAIGIEGGASLEQILPTLEFKP